MTCRELLAIEHPEKHKEYPYCGCPNYYRYASSCVDTCPGDCITCWDQEADEEAVKRVMGTVDKFNEVGHVNPATVDEIKQAMYKASGLPENIINHLETDENIKKQADAYLDMMKSAGPIILDSGDRTEFPSGAVRDMRVGKGRCDLLPLDVVKGLMSTERSRDIFEYIGRFQEEGDVRFLYDALIRFSEGFHCETLTKQISHMLLEVAKHFEEGAKKYGDNNWQKGIPVHCYIDSAVRHYLKYLRGDQDEPHDRAFCWNILCCIWTVKHIPVEEGKKDV